MNTISLVDLLKTGEEALKNNAYFYVQVMAFTEVPELILNPVQNIEGKLDYYQRTYDENLKMKANPMIKIVDYGYVTELKQLKYVV